MTTLKHICDMHDYVACENMRIHVFTQSENILLSNNVHNINILKDSETV